MLKSLIGNAKGRCGSTESRSDGGVSTVLNRKRCAGSVSVFRPIIKNSALISLIAFSLFSCNFGKGKISVEIIYPEKTLVNPSLSVTAQPAGGKAEEYKNKDGKELLISPVEAGNYSLIIRLKDGETVVWEKTVSCVVDGAITTRIRYTITEADFTGFALYPPEIIVTELGDGRYKIEILSVNYKGDICYTVTQPAEDPTASSPKYTTPFEIDYATEQGKVLTARVFYKDFDPSEPAVLYLTKVETPALQDTTAHRLNDKLTFSVTSSDTQAKYYYTLDGTVPNAVSSQTNGVIALTKPGTITVKGFKESYLMSDSVVLPVERLPKPVFGPVTENTGGLTYTVTIDYGNEAEAMFLTRDRTPVTSENCLIGTEIGLTGNPKYTVSDLTPEQTLKTRSIAVNFFASEEAVLESRAAEKPVITDARAGNATWADPLAVVFTSPEPGAVLRYTFDGSMPTQDSPSAVSGEEVPVTVPTENETDVTVRSYVDGKYPSSPVSVKTVKATAPKAVALNYWNRVEIEENDVIDVAEKATRRLFYRIEGSEAWLAFEGEVYLNATAQTTVEAVGGSEFYFPSEPVTEGTFTVLAKPAANDARPAGAAYLDPLRVTLSSNGVAADAVKYYYTVDGTEPTRISSTEAAESGVVSVGRTETLKAVATGLNRITSEVSDPVDGTPLNPPKLSVDDTGIVTITAADADQSVTGIVFYYKSADTAFSSIESGSPYDGSAPPQLKPGETLYAVAAAPMRNPSEKATLTLAQTDPPVFTDTRANLFYKPLSVAISGNNVLYAEGFTENDVKDPNHSYTDPVNPAGTSLWLGATAKDDEKLRSDLATRQLYRFAGAASVTVTHSATALNLVTITGPTAPTGFTGAVAVYYILDGTDFADSTTVQPYTDSFTVPQSLVEAAWTNGSLPVKIKAGGEFCHPSSDQSENILLTESPSITDARTEIYRTLKVTATATAPDDTATVYSSADGTTWSDVTGEVTVTPGDTLRFIAAVDGKLTSQIEEVDGTPLNPPTLKYENDGSVSVTAAAENGGNTFYYIVTAGDTADFETGTASELNGTTIPTDKIPDGQTVFVVAAEAGKNPSEPISPTQQEKTEKPTIADRRTEATYYQNPELEIRGNGSLFYSLGNAENAVKNPTTAYQSPLTPTNESWVGAAAQEDGKRKSDTVTQELKSFTAAPSLTLTHDEGNHKFNILNIILTNAGVSSPILYYTIDPTFGNNVLPFTEAAPLPETILGMIGNSVTVYTKAGAEFAYPSQAGNGTFDRSSKPNITDARTDQFYKTLQVSCDTAVYCSTDGTAWTNIQAGNTTDIAVTETGFFKVVETGKITSPVTEIPGTPLDEPNVTVDEATGEVTISVADPGGTNNGTVFYYVINTGDTVDFNTASGIQEYRDDSKPSLDTGETIHAVAGKVLKNPSSVVSTSRDDQTPPEKPVVTDSRTTGSPTPNLYFNPKDGTAGSITLNVSQAANLSVFYTYNRGGETQVSGGQLTVSSDRTGTYVFYAKDAAGQKSGEVTVDVKKLTAPQFEHSTNPPSASLTSSDGAAILYELSDPKKDVTETSPVYSAFTLTDLPGKTVTAVAVKEFCFSSPQTEQSIPSIIPPQPPQPPTVTDARTTQPDKIGNYFDPRPDSGPILLNITAAEPTDELYYKKDASGSETRITGNQISIEQSDAGLYIFYSKANGLSSTEVPIDVKMLKQPIITQNGGTATLSSPDLASILYTATDSSFEYVTKNSSEYSAGTDLSGKYVTAVAVKEFCFSSTEFQEQISAPAPNPVSITFRDAAGQTMANGTYREPQNVTIIVTPADATVTYSIGDQSYNQNYTGPISIDTNSDVYVKAEKAGETATAVLKIRLKCPNPMPQLTISPDEPDKYELTFPEFDTAQYTIKTATDTSDNTGTNYQSPMYLSPNDTIIVFATRTGWMNSDKILVSVPEILKKKGLNN